MSTHFLASPNNDKDGYKYSFTTNDDSIIIIENKQKYTYEYTNDNKNNYSRLFLQPDNTLIYGEYIVEGDNHYLTGDGRKILIGTSSEPPRLYKFMTTTTIGGKRRSKRKITRKRKTKRKSYKR